ncbi:MAG TPA: hypothetical protein VGX28_15540 [Frankiaceae bacterium]|jgi:hypothetical protein|nr:hypothetical protein [Frankiaceae bacterium]
MTTRARIGYAVAAVSMVAGGAAGARDVAPAPAVAQAPAAAPDRHDAGHARPAYLPAGATLVAERERDGVLVQRYALAGEANQDRMPTDISSYDGTSEAHPATYVDLYQTRRVPTMLGPVDRVSYDEAPVTIGDAVGRVVTPRDGYGTYRVSWAADGVTFLLSSLRLRTVTQGTSGVPVEELVRIARSVS